MTENAGCDTCGTNDRADGSNLCAGCGRELAVNLMLGAALTADELIRERNFPFAIVIEAVEWIEDHPQAGVEGYDPNSPTRAEIERADGSRTPSYADAINIARDLLSEDGENPEYDRAITELVADLYGVSGVLMDERKEQVARDLRALHAPQRFFEVNVTNAKGAIITDQFADRVTTTNGAPIPLANVPSSLLAETLAQIADRGYQWGDADGDEWREIIDDALKHAHLLNGVTWRTPDGWIVTVAAKDQEEAHA